MILLCKGVLSLQAYFYLKAQVHALAMFVVKHYYPCVRGIYLFSSKLAVADVVATGELIRQGVKEYYKARTVFHAHSHTQVPSTG